MNVQRFDANDFVFFLNIFTGNSGTELTHHHDDFLSYVVFYKNEEILIDLGRPNYRDSSPWVNSASHNGIFAEDIYFRPVSRFFVPRSFSKNSIDLQVKKDGDRLEAKATNVHTGYSKSISITQIPHGLLISEMLENTNRTHDFRYAHHFPAGSIEFKTREIVYFGNIEIKYHTADLEILPSKRSRAYGEITTSSSVYGKLGYDTQAELTWELTHAPG